MTLIYQYSEDINKATRKYEKNLDNKKIDENINFVNRNSRNGDLEVKIEDYEKNL